MMIRNKIRCSEKNMLQTKNPDDLQLIASHPVFCVYPVMMETAKGVEGCLLRANPKNHRFARNRGLTPLVSLCNQTIKTSAPRLINAERLF